MDTKSAEIEKSAIESPSEEQIENGSDLDFLADCQPREKRLIRKIDFRLLPILGGLYSIALVDRTNISNARVAGMEQELKLYIGNRYSIALVVFFIPYFIFELPSNIVLRKVGSANWLSFIALAWGTLMLGCGFIKNYESLVAFRVLIGFFEAGFFPACIIEGLITQIVAIWAYFLIIDFPDKATKKGFLTENEGKFIAHRIEEDRKDSKPDPLTWGKLGTHLCDWKLWFFAIMLMSTTLPSYAFAYFSPVIIRGMGYSASMANLMSAPPTIFSCFAALFTSWAADRFRIRAPFIVFQCLLGITGLMLVAYGQSNGVRYFGMFLGKAGCQGNVPAILAYQTNNIRYQSKRSVGSALQIGFGAIGGIMASTVFRQVDAPKYIPGLWVTTGAQFLIMVLVAISTLVFMKRNKEVDNGTCKRPIEGLEGFKYTI
ncbi:hypothetical protein FQN57_007513 [Myotisia sp. PD_48]|nr:hypothetical protein FQN57_007513 [Myotisia sp. PD_48]